MMRYHNPDDHILTIDATGNWSCSCGQWGSRLLGSINGEHCRKNRITEEVVRRWHASHANAMVVQLEDFR